MAKKLVKRILANYNLKKCEICGRRAYDAMIIYIFVVELMIGVILYLEIWKLFV